jgi:hypothetical protein
MRIALSVFLASIILVAGFVFSIPHANKDNEIGPSVETKSLSILPTIFIHDTYKKGIHSITGSLAIPTPCMKATTEALVLPHEGSTTPQIIHIEISIPEDAGPCLQLAATSTFSASLSADANVVIEASVNGQGARIVSI